MNNESFQLYDRINVTRHFVFVSFVDQILQVGVQEVQERPWRTRASRPVLTHGPGSYQRKQY